MNQPTRLDLTNKDVQEISGCTKSAASRRIKQCREALGKLPHQRITIEEYCKYYDYSYTKVLVQLKLVS